MPYFLCVNGNGVTSVRTDAEILQQLKHVADNDRPALQHFLAEGEEGDFYDYHNPEFHAVMEHCYYVRLGQRFFDDKRKRRTG